MTHSNLHLYPLSFPNEDQRMQISSYSSLANALGTDPGYASREGQRSKPMNCDAVVDKQTIYLSTLPVNNPLYPYPARNIFNPGVYPARTPSTMSRAGCPSNTTPAWENGENSVLHRLPLRYDLLPQPSSVELDDAYGHQAGVEFPAIYFLRKDAKDPHSVLDLLAMDTMPDLVGGDMPIFTEGPGRWIKIKLIWPGYSRCPFEKRISIKGSAPLTPTLLLMALAYHLKEFARYIQSGGVVVEPGQERWTITGVPEGAPAMWKDCIITSLRHLTGSIWQPEIYYLRE